jgi:putative acetyltransferase
VRIRAASNDDRDAIIALIDGCYREYGEVMYTDGADADLLDIEAAYAQRGGAFVVLVDDESDRDGADEGEGNGRGSVVGTHAVLPLADSAGACTFRRLYLHSSLRGGEWGRRLMRWALAEASARGFARVEFWSDTRFERAHRFFERLGFRRDGRVREMDDGALPYREYFFWFDLEAFEDLAQTVLEAFAWPGERVQGELPRDEAALRQVTAFRVGDLLERDQERLTQLFYRLDLDEADVRAYFQRYLGDALCAGLAELVIERTRARLARRSELEAALGDDDSSE